MPGLVLIGGKGAAEDRSNAKERENVGCCAGGGDLHGARIGASEIRGAAQGEGGNLREGFVAIAQIPVFGLGEPVLRNAIELEFSPNVDERWGVLVGEGTQEDGVHHAEDGGVRAHAESEREHGDDGEAGRFCEYAEPVADVLPKRLHHLHGHTSEIAGS